MSGFEIETHGMGDSFFLAHSMRQAFAEAWERLWMRRASHGCIQDLPAIRSSNGFASGTTVEDAVQRARSELIERAILLECWQKMSGWQPYRLRSQIARIIDREISLQEWTVHFHLLRDQILGGVLTGLARHPVHGALFDSIHVRGIRPNPTEEQKVTRSLLRSIAFIHSYENLPFQLASTDSPNAHRRFYSQPQNLKAFDFIWHNPNPNWTSTLPQPSKIQTTIIQSISNFPAVACAYHPEWKPLTWGTQSITEKNPWPHPLA